MTTATTGIGLKRLQHLVLWVSNVERSVRFYRDILGFEVKTQSPRAAFLRIPGSPDDHHLGLFAVAINLLHHPVDFGHGQVRAADETHQHRG